MVPSVHPANSAHPVKAPAALSGKIFEGDGSVYLVLPGVPLDAEAEDKLGWLLSARKSPRDALPGAFVGPRREMVTPWSTNAVEIAEGAGVAGLVRLERFQPAGGEPQFDPMLEEVYQGLDVQSLVLDRSPTPMREVTDLRAYNKDAGLSLSQEEIRYLETAARNLGRPLSDCEVFGFAQINSEHCRHKIFNGAFVLDKEPQERTLFDWIRSTLAANPGGVLTRYDDNAALFRGPDTLQFAPGRLGAPGAFAEVRRATLFSLKAETHNFPTTVEPFNGAATGSGGEIRDRMAPGRGGLPLAGTACYMTAYPRLAGHAGESGIPPRDWLYQSPREILIKASNGASDFGNKFGQPLINGSLFTLEALCGRDLYAYDKCVMLAGGIGLAYAGDARKKAPRPGDIIAVMGGDNYRIGMGGGAVSSAKTGAYSKHLEMNAVQRSNPEMQKRVFNAIRALLESGDNPILTLHDHGAGGHINCLSEMVEKGGGLVEMGKLPTGDPTLSDLEILGNESQERMGLVVSPEDVERLRAVALRERAPLYLAGTAAADGRLVFENREGKRPVDLPLEVFLGKPPAARIEAETLPEPASDAPAPACRPGDFAAWLREVLALEAVGSKDWLTNKVDRSVGGLVARQQCVGPLQLPLQGAGVMALDFTARHGLATSMGHQPAAGLLDAAAGSRLAIAEALGNLVFVPMDGGLAQVTLSANWMWSCRSPGEASRLYRAVRAAAEFATGLGLCISTGKDSLFMSQKYPDGSEVRAPGTVIVSAAGPCANPAGICTPDLEGVADSQLLWLDFSGMPDAPLGGSALSQVQGRPGGRPPDANVHYLGRGFALVQEWLERGLLLAGQDVSAGGLVVAAAEMAMAGSCGVRLEFPEDQEATCELLFCEKPGVVVQVRGGSAAGLLAEAGEAGVPARALGAVDVDSKYFAITCGGQGFYSAPLAKLLEDWYSPSGRLEPFQAAADEASSRRRHYGVHPLEFTFPGGFTGSRPEFAQRRARAAILREKGTNGDREMAYALYAAGFEVWDVTMTDLAAGRADLSDVRMLVYCGGFSHSDVLGSARGWAGAFRYNPRAAEALGQYYARPDTLSLGVCNGCQLMALLDLVSPASEPGPALLPNASGKFESAFLPVEILPSPALMLAGLEGSRLGVWVAHGEGRFQLPESFPDSRIAVRYACDAYPCCPNGSDRRAAGLVSPNGRHLALMPHPERSIFPWQWGWYPPGHRLTHRATPWLQAFVNARQWVEKQD